MNLRTALITHQRLRCGETHVQKQKQWRHSKWTKPLVLLILKSQRPCSFHDGISKELWVSECGRFFLFENGDHYASELIFWESEWLWDQKNKQPELELGILGSYQNCLAPGPILVLVLNRILTLRTSLFHLMCMKTSH